MALSVPKNSDINLYSKELAELLRKAIEDTRTHRSIILTLLNRGANTNYKPKNKKFTTFEHIIFHGDERDLITAFLAAGARNNSIVCYTKGGEHPYGETHSRGMTLFHAAVISRNFKNIDALLWGGADINSVDENGDTALHYCKHGPVDRGSLEREVYDFLVSRGADTGAMNNDRLTPQGRADQILQGRPIVDEGHIRFQ